MELTLEFGFDAAHWFDNPAMPVENRRVHGHSFRVEVAVAGTPDPISGFIADFATLERAALELRGQLDHQLLNDIPGLAVPSLENIACWIWHRLSSRIAGLSRITIRRPSLGQSCTYFGPDNRVGRSEKGNS